MLHRAKPALAANPFRDSWEHRRAARRKVLAQAKILLGREAIFCAIRDVSDTGAKLEVGADVKLPADFDVAIVAKETIVRVRLRWRDGDFAGLSFLTRLAAPL